jgi:hypothetical protein
MTKRAEIRAGKSGGRPVSPTIRPASAWARGYGVLRDQTETRAHIAEMVGRIGVEAEWMLLAILAELRIPEQLFGGRQAKSSTGISDRVLIVLIKRKEQVIVRPVRRSSKRGKSSLF